MLMETVSKVQLIPIFPILYRRRFYTSTATTTTTKTGFFPSIYSHRRSTLHLQIPYKAPPVRRQMHCSYGFNPLVNGGGIGQDAVASAIVLVGAYTLVYTFDTLTQRGLIQQKLSRKLVHILSGLLFAVSWPIFSNSRGARYFASFVPLVNCLRLVINGLSLVKADEGLIKSVTREGNPKELLRGPLCYVLVLILCAILFWRESPSGLIALTMMCGGDGVADIMGRRFGGTKLPYNEQKSWAGSISMFTCGFLVSVGILYYYSVLGYFQLDWLLTMQRVALVSLVATAVESLPITGVLDDNISVPLVSMIMAYWSFGN